VILRVLGQIASSESGHAGRQILDVGCGDGLFFDQLADLGSVTGIEPDSDLVDPAGPHASQIHVGLLDHDYHASQPQDWILMLDVLEHMDQPAEALQQALHLLRPGGRLVVTVPAFKMLWTKHDEFNHHRTRYRRSELEQLVREQGFQVESSRYFFHWTFPAKLLVRFKETILPGKPRPARVPVAPLNIACRLLTEIEQRLLAWLQLPFGSSILLVAQRPMVDREAEPGGEP
jgi:SAM-dependent methyltransferase